MNAIWGAIAHLHGGSVHSGLIGVATLAAIAGRASDVGRGCRRRRMAQATDCSLPLSIPTHWLISLAGNRCSRIQVSLLSRRRYSSQLTVCLQLMFLPIPRCSRPVPAATLGRPASPVLPTCVTDRAPATSRSSGAPLCLVNLATQFNQHRPVLIPLWYRVFIKLVLFGCQLAP